MQEAEWLEARRGGISGTDNLNREDAKVDIHEIPFASGYGVTSDGRVFSRRPPNGKGGLSEKWREMRQRTILGYPSVSLFGNKIYKVHTLVVSVFIGNIPKGKCVNHIDGNKRNNNVSNLEIVTYSENSKHAHATGLQKVSVGSECSFSKINELDAMKIFELAMAGEMSQNNIAKMFGISQTMVSRIKLKKAWTHIYE